MEPPCTSFRQTARAAAGPGYPVPSSRWRWASFLILFSFILTVTSPPTSHDGVLSVFVPQFPSLCGLQLAQGQVIGMDLGSEFVKVALVAAGRPMEIILNAASKRKTSHAVSFADSEKRDMGDEGAAAASKRPDHVFMHSNLFLGLNATEVDSTFSVSSVDNVCQQEAASGTESSEKCSKDQESRFLPLKLQAEQSLLREVGYPHGYYPYRLYADRNRHTVAFLAREGMYLSAEMVTANFLAYLRKMAAQSANVPSTTPIGVVISVPCRFSQRQRQALRDAAEIAGLRPIALVHHAAAAATQHALDTPIPSSSSSTTAAGAGSKTSGGAGGGGAGSGGKASSDSQANQNSSTSSSGTGGDSSSSTSLEPSTKLFVDVGSAAVDFSLVRFEPVPVSSSSSKSKDAAGGPLTLSAQMLSCETLYGIGGHNVDIGLAEMMREAFQKRYPAQGDLRQTPRALKKLLKQAVLSKHILSANKKTQFSVEGLLTTESGAELDLHELVDRSHVETVLERMQLRMRMQQALQKTLQQAHLELKDIDQIELLGGGWRVPHVQQELSAVLDGRSPGMHLNGDEAMATGAAFIAANSTITFRVKKYYLTDITPYEYSLKMIYKPSSGGAGSGSGGGEHDATTVAADSGAQQQQQQEGGEGEEEEDLEESKHKKDVTESSKEKAEITEKHITLYARNSKFGGTASSKTVSVRTPEDFTVHLLEDETVLETITVRGVAEAIAKQHAAAAALAEQEAEKQEAPTTPGSSSSKRRILEKQVLGDPKISLVFTVDGSGVLGFDRAFATFTVEITEEVIVPSPTTAEGAGGEASEAPSNTEAAASASASSGEAAGAETDTEKSREKENSKTRSSTGEEESLSDEKREKSTTTSPEKDQEKKEGEETSSQEGVATTPTVASTVKQRRKRQVVEALTGERVLALPLPLTQEEKQQLRQQLADLEAADLQVHLLSEGINRLETFIYATRGALDEESVLEVMKPEDVEKLRQQLQEDEDYLYANAKQEGLEAVQKKQEELEAIVVPMRKRAAERTARPGVIKAMTEGLAAAETRLQRLAELQQKHQDWPPQEKMKKAQRVNETVVQWWREKSAEQETREKWEDPAFTLVDARKKLRELEAAIIAAEEAPKPTPKQSSSSSTSTGGKKSAAAAARRKKAARDARAAAEAEKTTTPPAPGDSGDAGIEEDGEEQQQQQSDGEKEGPEDQKETERTTQEDSTEQQGDTDQEASKEGEEQQQKERDHAETEKASEKQKRKRKREEL